MRDHTYKQSNIRQVGQKFPDRVSKTLHVDTFHLIWLNDQSLKHFPVRDKDENILRQMGLNCEYDIDCEYGFRISNQWRYLVLGREGRS